MRKKFTFLILFFLISYHSLTYSQDFECCEPSLAVRDGWNLSDFCFFSLEVGPGYKKFYDFPKVSYAMEGPVTPANYNTPFSRFTAKDQPQSVYVEMGLSFVLPECFTPCFLNSDILISANGTPYFRDEYKRNISIFTDVNVALPNIAGPQIQLYDLTIGTNNTNGPGYFTRRYSYSEVSLAASLSYCLLGCLQLEPFVEVGFNRLGQGFKWYLEDQYTVLFIQVRNTTYLDETLITRYTDAGGGFNLALPFLRCFLFNLRGGLYASHASNHLHGHYQTGGDTITPIDSFASLYKDVWNTKFKGCAGISYLFRDHTILSFVGKYEYWGFAPIIKNPQVNADGTVIVSPLSIGNDSLANYSLEGKIGFFF